MRKGVRVKSAPKVHSLVCPICGKRVVGLSRRQAEEDLRNHLLEHSEEEGE